MKYIVALLSLCLLTLVTACTPANKKQIVVASEDKAIDKSLSGVLFSREEKLWFQPCGERLWWPLSDNTPDKELSRFYQRFAADNAIELYTEIRGSVLSSEGNILQAKYVDLIGGGRNTCSFRLEGLEFRAASSAPYWVADIRHDRIAVKSVNPIGSYNFFSEQLPQSETEGRLVYREITPVKKPMEMRILLQRCEDKVNGTILPYTAEMKLFGQVYRGCARHGHSPEELVSGVYWFEQNGQQVIFRLRPDHRAQLVRKDAGGNTHTDKGEWQYLESGKLILSMRDHQQKEFIMLLRHQSDGGFKLQTPQPLAPLGAHFMRWKPSGLEGGQLLQLTHQRSEERRAALPVRKYTPEAVIPASVEDTLVNEIMVSQ